MPALETSARNRTDAGSPLASALRRARKRSVLRRPLVAWRHRNLADADTLLVSFPRSGSTWLRFMLAGAIAEDPVDFASVDEVIPYVGSDPTQRTATWGTSGHLIKSHERHSTLGAQGRHRFIYLIRDGRDVAVSYYFFCQRHGTWVGSFSAFLEAFLSARLDGYGSWQSHVEGWLGDDGPDRDHILVRYEDLHADAAAELRRCAEFLDTGLDEEKLEQAIATGSADRMRAAERRSPKRVSNPSIPNVRATSSKNWREHFSDRDLQEFRRRAGAAAALGGYDLD